MLYEAYDDKSFCPGILPDRLQGNLFPGGSTEGDVCFQVPADETGLILTISPSFGFNTNERRYIKLQ